MLALTLAHAAVATAILAFGAPPAYAAMPGYFVALALGVLSSTGTWLQGDLPYDVPGWMYFALGVFIPVGAGLLGGGVELLAWVNAAAVAGLLAAIEHRRRLRAAMRAAERRARRAKLEAGARERPEDAFPLKALAELALEEGDVDAALEAFARAHALEERVVSAGDLDQARRHWKRAEVREEPLWRAVVPLAPLLPLSPGRFASAAAMLVLAEVCSRAQARRTTGTFEGAGKTV